jgi:hypothetical protein
MWERMIGWVGSVLAAVLRLVRAQPPDPVPLSLPAPRPAPPVLVSVTAAPSPSPSAPAAPPPLTWSAAWQSAWRGERLAAPAVPVLPPRPLPPRPRRSKAWLFTVLLAELQAGVLLGAVWAVVTS